MSRLLIIGAGGHGEVVKEIAEDIGTYEEIAFIDDDNEKAIGAIGDLEKLRNKFDSAFVAIGNCSLRGTLLDKLAELSYNIPILVHPTAYVSRSATIGVGTIVEPKAIINAHADVGRGCIISIGSIVEHDAVIEECAHINSGAICMARSRVQRYQKVDAGDIIRE